MNATASFNGKSSHNDHIMPGTVSKNVSKGVGGKWLGAKRLGWESAKKERAEESIAYSSLDVIVVSSW